MSKPEKKNIFESTDFDNAICLTGYGKFHIETITACAICILTVGFQNGLSSYVFPAAQCELSLTSYDIGFLNVSFLIGGIVSSFLWGALADLFGRRKVLILTHLVNFLVTIICVTNSFYISLVLCRFLNGFLIGAPGSIIFSYLAEFQPPKYRGAIVCYCGLFFTLAWLILPLTAYFVLPLDISVQFGWIFILTPWRIFFILLVVPEFLVGLWFIKLPESPKFYMAKGNTKYALDVLKRMYAGNTGKDPEKFPVKKLISEIKLETDNVVCNGKTSRILRSITSGMKKLFRPPLLSVTLLTCAIMCANMFGVFGLGLWLPELFTRFQRFQEQFPNQTVTVKELSQLPPMSNVSSCEPSFDNSVIQNTVAMAISSLVFNAVSGFIASKVQLKLIPLVSMMLGGLSSLSIYWLTSSMQNLVVSCIFQASMVTANMTIGSVVVELFPTTVGGIAICLIMCSGRIGAMCSNIVFGYLMDKHCEIPIFVVAVVVLIGALLCFLIPKKNDQEQSDNIYIGSKAIEISVIPNEIK